MSVVSAPARRLSTTTVYGLTVVVESVRSEGRAALAVHHRAGFRREAVGEEGVAHLLEHVMFRGSAAVPRGTFHDHVLGFAGHAGRHHPPGLHRVHPARPGRLPGRRGVRRGRPAVRGRDR
ncbi:insulinase family protein [Rhodococcus kroppenstedtii]|nr:insulinase family protein [Rhodococcus kroppenstedtii]